MSAECIRAAGHSGPCNGLPRLDAGRYCYQLRSGSEGHQEHAAYGKSPEQLKSDAFFDGFEPKSIKVHVPYSGMAEGYGDLRNERDDLRIRVRELEFTIAKLQQQLFNANLRRDMEDRS